MRMGMGMLPDESNRGALTRNLRRIGRFEENSLQEEVYNCPIAWNGQDFDKNIGEELSEIMRGNTLVRSVTSIHLKDN